MSPLVKALIFACDSCSTGGFLDELTRTAGASHTHSAIEITVWTRCFAISSKHVGVNALAVVMLVLPLSAEKA
jgi:hypothetical protein